MWDICWLNSFSYIINFRYSDLNILVACSYGRLKYSVTFKPYGNPSIFTFCRQFQLSKICCYPSSANHTIIHISSALQLAFCTISILGFYFLFHPILLLFSIATDLYFSALHIIHSSSNFFLVSNMFSTSYACCHLCV